MESNVIIHIGLHKTGTSSVQAFLYENREKLRSQGVIYECMDENWANHHPIAVGWTYAKKNERVVDFLNELLSLSEGKTLLLSSEMFAEANFDVESFLDFFSDRKVRVVAYLRNPCDQIVSSFNQVVRDPKTRWTDPMESKPFPYDPSYYALLRRWMLAPKLELCPYDSAQWYNGSLLSDFCNTIGVDNDGLIEEKRKENVSIPPAFLEIVRSMNNAGISEEPRSKIIDLLKHEARTFEQSTQYPLSVEACEEIIDFLRAKLSDYRNYFRPGFDSSFLTFNPAKG